jgi:hypothetical protein
MPRLSVSRITFGTIVRVGSIVCLCGIIAWYMLFQARNFINGPVIELQGTYDVVQTERVVPIHGIARNIVKITLDGREITTDKEGVFSDEIVLESGYTVMTLEAFDRFGRETEVTREFVFKPE